MMDDKWIDNLKVGDRVIVSHGLAGNHEAVTTVEKITPSRIITVKGWKDTFDKNGWERGVRRERGASFYGKTLREATPERVEAIRFKNRCARLDNVEWKNMPADLVAQVWALVKPHAEKE